MRTRMRMIVPVASVALLTATVGAAAATASSTGPASSPSASKSSGGAGEPSKTPPSGGCGGGGGVTKTPPPPGTPDPKEVQVLAGILHVSQAKATQVLERLDQIARQDDGITPTDPKFVALAQSLHLTPQQLSDDLVQLKKDLAKLMPNPSDSGKPAPSSSKS